MERARRERDFADVLWDFDADVPQQQAQQWRRLTLTESEVPPPRASFADTLQELMDEQDSLVEVLSTHGTTSPADAAPRLASQGSPYTPTEPDCFSTELDEQSDLEPSSLDVAHASVESAELAGADAAAEAPTGPWQDTLLDRWEAPATPPPSPARSSEDFDSQLTDNEDPNVPSPREPEAEPVIHWTRDDAFWNGVDDILSYSVDRRWFDHKFWLEAPVTFDRALAAAVDYINDNIVGTWLEYKIGITENPFLRWTRNDCGYQHDGWSTMFLLYAAPSSKPRIQDSTGAMEKQLISVFAGNANGCINRKGAGGDAPSDGSPHFTYVVVRGAVGMCSG